MCDGIKKTRKSTSLENNFQEPVKSFSDLCGTEQERCLCEGDLLRLLI